MHFSVSDQSEFVSASVLGRQCIYHSKSNKVCRLAWQNTPPPLNPVVCLVILKVKVLLSVYANFVVPGLANKNSKSAHALWLPWDHWYRRYGIHKESIMFWTFTVTLTLKTTIQFLHKTFQLMMMYHLIKFGCRKTSSSMHIAETVIFDYMSPHCDLELEDSKPIFSRETLAYDEAS